MVRTVAGQDLRPVDILRCGAGFQPSKVLVVLKKDSNYPVESLDENLVKNVAIRKHSFQTNLRGPFDVLLCISGLEATDTKGTRQGPKANLTIFPAKRNLEVSQSPPNKTTVCKPNL